MMRANDLKLGHLNSAIDQHSERPKSPTRFIDYRAPEMVTLKSQQEAELLFTRTAHILKEQQQQHEQQHQQYHHHQQQQHPELDSIQESGQELLTGAAAGSTAVPGLPLGRLLPAAAGAAGGGSTAHGLPGHKPPVSTAASPRSALYLSNASQQQAQQHGEGLSSPRAPLSSPRAPAQLPGSSSKQLRPSSARAASPSPLALPLPTRGYSNNNMLSPRLQVQAAPRGSMEPEQQQAALKHKGSFRRWATTSASQLLQGIVGTFR
jgi:hypothetical protein